MEELEYEVKDRVIIGLAFFTLTAGLFPGLVVLPWSMSVGQYQSAVAGRMLQEAREEAREFGEERRSGIRTRAREVREERALEKENGREALA